MRHVQSVNRHTEGTLHVTDEGFQTFLSVMWYTARYMCVVLVLYVSSYGWEKCSSYGNTALCKSLLQHLQYYNCCSAETIKFWKTYFWHNRIPGVLKKGILFTPKSLSTRDLQFFGNFKCLLSTFPPGESLIAVHFLPHLYFIIYSLSWISYTSVTIYTYLPPAACYKWTKNYPC